MWTDLQFWRDSTWRAFRTLCQSLAGLLVVQQVSNAFDAPWKDLLGASLLAALTSLLMSVDRERVAVDIKSETVPPVEGCGGDLR